MIIAIDVETQGLDATKFIMASMVKENHKKHKIYYDKNKLWNDIIQLGIQEKKRGKILNVYSHNANYDFCSYANLKDRNIKWLSTKPFIVTYTYKEKEIIKFLDTLAIFRMSLKEIGKLIKHEKTEMPKELLNNKQLTPKQLKQTEQYCINDSQICLKSIQYMKNKLQKDGIKIKRLYTINQIAIQYLLNELKKTKHKKEIFWNEKKNEIRRTKNPEKIHQAYRGGRVETFQTGTIPNITHIDINSLYPYAATQIKFPKQKTEKLIIKPLRDEKNGGAEIGLIDLLDCIGISKAMIKNHTNEIGLLPIRAKKNTYYPKKGKTLIGTYTHQELRLAIEEGYQIQDIEWSIIYADMENPLKNIMNKLYNKRIEDQTPFNKYFYKSMMNCSIGKLAQTKTGQEIIIDSVENAKDYIKQQYEIIKGIDYDYMYQKTYKTSKTKPYYWPIIPTLINAQARIILYKEMKKIPKKDLIYTDTDSIFFQNGWKHLHKFNIGNNLGQFKIEHRKETITIYGKKTYSIGGKIKIAGTKRNQVTTQQFEEGEIKDRKMITIKTAKEIEDVGTFKTETRNLKEQEQNHKQSITLMEQEKLYIDHDILNITYFMPIITKNFK